MNIGGHLAPTLFELSCNQLKLAAMSSIPPSPIPAKLHIFPIYQHFLLSWSPAQINVENSRIRGTEMKLIIQLTRQILEFIKIFK